MRRHAHLIALTMPGATLLAMAPTALAQGIEETLVFQQSVNGYNATQDTWIDEDYPNSSYGGASTKWCDDDTANSIWSDYAGQALLRFDDLMGDEWWQIPAGSQIVSATLEVHVVEDNDSPFWTPTVYVHQVTRDWDEGSTWNSLGGGLSVPADMMGHFATFSSDNEPEEASHRAIGVTAQVNDWFHGGDGTGAANWGFAFIFENIDGNDDGIEIASSENGTVEVRPKLSVTFVRPDEPPPPPNDPGDLNGDGLVNAADLAIVLGKWGTSDPLGDANGDGLVDGADMAVVIGNWQ